MSSLKARLAKAKSRLFGTAVRDVPVPFELPCDCGHRVAGIRRPTFQVAVCSACQSSVYVLPVNVYPGTRRVRSEVLDGPVISRVGTIVRDLVLGENNSAADKAVSETRASGRADAVIEASPETSDDRAGSRRRKSTSKSSGSASNVTEATKAEPVIEHAATGTPLVLVPRVSAAVRLKKVFSPTRLLALAGMGILVVTGWWMIRQQQMDEARKVWRREMDLVETALQDHDLQSLQSALQKAVDAAIVLNRSDAESREAESLLRQTEAVQNLGSADLVTLLSGFVRSDGSFDSEKASRVRESMIGQRLVFEAPLRTTSGNSQIPELSMPLIVDGIPVRVAVPSPWLLKYAQAEPSLPLLFVAAIKACQPPADPSGEWQMSLDPVSCILITSEFHAREIGFDVKNISGLRKTLERQAEFVRSTAVTPSDMVIVSDEKVGP